MNLFIAFAHHWAVQFWSVSTQATTFIILAYAMAICFRRAPARYRYALWLLVLIRLAIPISLRSPWGVGQYPEQLLATSIRWISGQTYGPSYLQSNPKMPVEARFWLSSDDSALPLCLLWMLGILVLGLAIMFRFLQLRRRIDRLLPTLRPDLLSLLDQMIARLGLKGEIRLLKASDDIRFPSVFGIIRPTIILPSSMASDWTAQALEPVLLHELMHIKRRDCLVNLVQIVLQVLYFYHPMVWLANWTTRREREFACDDEVVRGCGGCPTAYIHSMVRVVETFVHHRRQQLLGIAMAEGFSNLTLRIRRMTHKDYQAKERYAFIYFAAVIVLGLFCAGVACSRQENSKVYVVGKDVTAPMVLAQPLPPYTDEAREAHAEGIVLLQAVIRKNGSVEDFKVLRGLGHGLDESAIKTIAEKWRFKPGTHNGIPVDVQANIEISFKLY